MLESLSVLLPDLAVALGQTLLMLGIGLGAAMLAGGPLGILLYLAGEGQPPRNRALARLLGWTVDMVRAFPFIVLLLALIPFMRLVAGSSVGPLAAAVPLSVAAIPYFARLVEQTLREVPRGVIEAAQAMGASELQIVVRVLLVEARSGLVLALTGLAVSFLSYAAVAGVLGGGGIGEFALLHGYHRFEADIMAFTAIVLVVLVQVIQLGGASLAQRLDKGRP